MLFIKGIIIGIANIIPGVSGGTLAVSLGIYELLLDAIGNFFRNIKENFLALLPIILGAVVGILSGSNLVTYALKNFQAQTIFLFVGLIIGGISLITKKVKGNFNVWNIIIFLITFAIVVAFNFMATDNVVSFSNLKVFDYIKLFFAGAFASGAMVIPGISGSFILMLFGYYEGIIETVSNLIHINLLGQNLMILLPFGVGVLLGIILIAKLISYLIKKHEVKTYFAITGFVLSSVVVLITQIKDFNFTFLTVITCLIAFLWGFFLARNLEKE